MTEKLYYSDSYITNFSAKVISCTSREDGNFDVLLDRTGFFPCEGGQNADKGVIGEADVIDVFDGADVVHIVDKALAVGEIYECNIDWNNKLRNLQNHSGEHIVSGLICSKYGLDNVGFHLGTDEVTLDFSGYVDDEALREIELLANKAIVMNIKIKAEVLSVEEAKERTYRSKKEIKEDIRIVTIDGYDVCACCAPHVNYTGEIGQIKILDSMHYKGGVRIWIACGFDALRDYTEKHDSVKAISQLLSLKQNEVLAGVNRLIDTISERNAKISLLKEELLELKLKELEHSPVNIVVFESEADMNFMRKYANCGVKLTEGVFGIFGGNDYDGYKYIIASDARDLKSLSKDINSALRGNGGGSATMIQGSAKATKAEIEKYFDTL